MSANYHHGDLKPALLAYAREQMEHGNLEALSMRAMARAIGVSHTAAYRHFASKHALLDAVTVQGFEDILASCESAVQCAGRDPRSRLKACGLAYVQFGATFPSLLAHMFSSASGSQASAALSETGSRFFDMLLTLIRDGQSRHVFKTGDSRQLAHACWAMVHGLSVLLNIGPSRGKSPSSAIHVELAIETFLDGLSSPATPAKALPSRTRPS